VQEPRYLIRAIPANSVDQIYCQRLADMAVHNALARYTDFMISQWLTEYVLVPLKLVAKGHKKIPQAVSSGLQLRAAQDSPHLTEAISVQMCQNSLEMSSLLTH